MGEKIQKKFFLSFHRKFYGHIMPDIRSNERFIFSFSFPDHMRRYMVSIFNVLNK